jgi:hypothetical protein
VVDGIRTINQGFPAGYFDKYVDDEGGGLYTSSGSEI